MAISIVHRITGSGLATVGALGLVWWLAAAASGKDAYDQFLRCATSIPGYIVLIGLSWLFVQHMLSGLRHFVLDTGAGYELKTNKGWSTAIFFLSPMLTALLWLYIFRGSF